MKERNLSENEKLYRILQKKYETFSIQFIIEGIGKIESSRLKNAIYKSLKYTPLINGIHRLGKWCESENTPKIVLLEEERIDIESPIFRVKNDIERDGGSSIYIFQNGIVFNIFHGIADGKGVQLWIENIFRILNEKTPLVENSFENNEEFVEDIAVRGEERKLNLDIKIPRNKTLNRSRFFHITLPYSSKNTIYRVGKIVTDTLNSGKQRFMIPTDIRKYKKNTVTTSNLVLPIILEVAEGERIGSIRERFLKSLRNKEELLPINRRFLNLVVKNDRLGERIVGGVEFVQNILGRNMGTGTISNLGKVSLENFSTDTFKATKIYSVPVVQPYAPLAINIIENNSTTEIVLGVYKKFIGMERVEEIVSSIKGEILGESKKLEREDDFLYRVYQNIKANPNKEVIFTPDQSYSYRELEQRIISTVENLKLRGCGNGDGVVVLLERGIEYLAAVLAVNFLGGYFIPIDTESSVEKISYILKNSQAKILITNSGFRVGDINSLEVDKMEERKGELNLKEMSRDGLAYVIYTSGTTNKPKGVKIKRESLSNYLKWSEDFYNFSSEDCFAFFTSVEVDLSITSYFLPLYTGGKIYIYRDRTDMGGLKSIFSNEKINFIKLTPTHLKIIKDLQIEYSGEKNIIVGGESFKQELAQKIKNKFLNVQLYNEYGPTETTVAVTGYKLERLDGVTREIPIGKPIYNSKILLVDGEIYIQGLPLGEGYIGESIKNNGYLFLDEERAYKSDDLGYQDLNGNLIYLGRKGEEIKYLGYRVDIGEVIDEIKSGVDEVEEIYLKNNDNILELYVVAEERRVREVYEYIHENISKLKLKRVYWSESIPISSGGKIEFNRFKRWYSEQRNINENQEEYIKIIEIIGNILQEDIKNISKSDNFFLLGGDSADYIILQSEIIKVFGIEEEERFYKEMDLYYDNLTVESIMKIIRSVENEKC